MAEINDSGHLAAADWEGGVLSITFRDGATYQYHDVPVGVFYELMESPSKSTFFRSAIKGIYEYSRV